MSAWDDLIVRASELKLNGAESHQAAEAVVKANPALVQIAAIEQLMGVIRRRDRHDWKWAGEAWDQLTLFVDDQRFQIDDRKVRFVNLEGKEDFKPRRFATGRESRDSKEACIRLHIKESARIEREYTQEKQVGATLENLGFDFEDGTWDSIKHRDTICQRCGGGYDPDDPFVIGHKIAAVQGGEEIGWEHHSCNASARANPVPSISEDDTDAP